MSLIIVLSVWFIGVFLCVIAMKVGLGRYLNKLDSGDNVLVTVFTVFWPFVLPIFVLIQTGIAIYKIGDQLSSFFAKKIRQKVLRND